MDSFAVPSDLPYNKDLKGIFKMSEGILKRLMIFIIIGMLTGCANKNLQETPIDPTNPRSRLEGKVIYKSDVALKQDTVLANQLVLVFSVEDSSSIIGVDVDPSELRFLHHMVSGSPDKIMVVMTDHGGNFDLTLPPGEYVLCLADEDSNAVNHVPAMTRGCGKLSIKTGMTNKREISSGYGEIEIIEKK